MTGLSGISRFGKPKQLVCSLATTGTLPNHSPGRAYTGSFGVAGATGDITAELVSSSSPLPAGWSLSVNQTTDQVTLSWPGTAAPGATPLGNLNFESGDVSWLKGSRWAIDTTGLKDGGTWSAKYDGPGQSTLQHVQAVPVMPGTNITASCRISKGNNREDFAGGAVVLQWLDNTYTPISFNVGNVVNAGASAFQTSTVTATAPPGSSFVRLAASGTRDTRGRARDKVYADNFAWSHSYAIPSPPGVDYDVVIRVRDGRGCQATFSQTIGQSVAPAATSLLNFNGTNGSTTFTDETGKTWSRTGTSVITTAQSKYGGASLSLPTISSGISTNASIANIARGTDFCVEFWLLSGNTTGDIRVVCKVGGPAGITPTNGLMFLKNTPANSGISLSYGGTGFGTTAGFSDSAFAHIAFSVQHVGGDHISRLFLDGVLAAGGSTSPGTFPMEVVFGSTSLWLGHGGTNRGLSNGCIDDFRLVIGSPVYTAGFTPPPQLTL